MATKNNYSLIRGRRMRVTRLDGCGQPIYGADSSQAVTDGFVSIAFTAQTTEAEEIIITNAAGQTCARDPGSPEFNGYQLEITFCGVQPCIFEMITGQPPVTDYMGDTVGFKMNSSIDQSASAFALEVWAGVPGVECTTGGGGSYGYILVPYVSSGVVGDFTIENGAVNFVVNGASTKDGNGWGAGPYNVVPDTAGAPAQLPVPLDKDDHLYVVWTPVNPPEVTDGCVDVVKPPDIPLTGVVAESAPGEPGYFTPPNGTIPTDLADLIADTVVGNAAQIAANAPSWTTGQFVVLGDNSEASWNNPSWQAGPIPQSFPVTGVEAGNPGKFLPDPGASVPYDLAELKAHAVVGDTGSAKPTTAWTTGQHVVLGNSTQASWDGTAWIAGAAALAARSASKA